MRNFFHGKELLLRRIFLLVFDIAAIVFSGYMALLFRYEFDYNSISKDFLNSFWEFIPINLLITILLFFIFRLYHSLWSFAGVSELQNILVACILSSIVQFVGFQFLKFPMAKSYYPLSGIMLFALIAVSRFSYRFFRLLKRKRYNIKNGTNVMIIGAGDAGNLLIKELINSDHISKIVKCIIDDDESKIGRYINGVKVVGNRSAIPEYASLYNIDEIIIAMPSVSRRVIREISSICQQTECRLKTLPGMYQLVNGEVSVNSLKDVDVEDLLGRDPVQVDLNSIISYVKNKTILVTGGGGSIGSELCRQISAHCPRRLIIADIYENNAYSIQQELRNRYPDLDLIVLIASVRNTVRINHIFEEYRPDIVYHAAAHKHVPLMEDSPYEAIKNNVFGTLKTARAADQYGAEKFVMISTDKAVNPTNIMGASKRICEMIVQTLNKNSTTEFVAVRFGNVLGSNGSVIPLFKQQIQSGGPVTVTHPDIIRYFMTIPEAVSLVLQAGAYAKGGEIFILDMGEPVKILDLAVNLIRLSGFVPYEDIMIEFTGLRPGEKLYEELLMDEEGMMDTENKMIHIGKPIEIDEKRFILQMEELRALIREEPENEVLRAVIKRMVPTYSYDEVI